ncbi:MAG: hypothetical protein JWP41_3506 [Ramlibacter sp.]|jgi:hypothetical protein|nr:hypothetical protein [Ramlibacter sp.]
MDQHPADTSRRIDLTRQVDVLDWCRVFDVTMEELRDAVHHAGHRVEDVGRFLRQKRQAAADRATGPDVGSLPQR